MRRRSLIAGCLAAVLAGSLVGGATAGAEIPRGPHLAVVVGGTLLLTGPNGESPHVVEGEDQTGEAFISGRPVWSPDGRELAFFAWRVDNPEISLIDADGSDLRVLGSGVVPYGVPTFDPTTGDLVVVGVGPEPSPIGGSEAVARAGYWSIATDGSGSRLLGRFKDYSVAPYSIAPDGSVAASVGGPHGEGPGPVGIVTFDPRHEVRRVVVPPQENGDHDPAVSPDGTEIAYVHYRYGPASRDGEQRVLSTDLMVVPFAGGRPRRVVRIAGSAQGPSWDPSGSRIAFSKPAALMEVNADGTCLTKVYSSSPGELVNGAAWQPGAGRGTGPLSCRARRGRAR